MDIDLKAVGSSWTVDLKAVPIGRHCVSYLDILEESWCSVCYSVVSSTKC